MSLLLSFRRDLNDAVLGFDKRVKCAIRNLTSIEAAQTRISVWETGLENNCYLL